MRLFVAIDLDDGAREATARVQAHLAKALDTGRSIKWVSPAHIHLTLTFLGEMADSAVPPIVKALSTNIDVRSFTVVFQGLDVFPSRGAPRVLWLGVGDGRSDVIDAQRAVTDRVAGAGLIGDRRPFHPHLTLARWRSSRPDDARRALSAGPEGPIARVGVDHVTLYHSRLTPVGPIHTALARATLT